MKSKKSERKPSARTTQITLHSVQQVLGNQKQISLFSDQHEQFAEEFGITLNGSIERFGVDLTDFQSRVMEGILHGFSLTSYRGNLESKDKEDLAEEKFDGRLPPTYKYVKEIPRLRATQSDIMDWAGVNRNSMASCARAVEAIKEVGTKQYCFFYDRLVFDSDGKPVKDRNGQWKKEEVTAVDTLFTIKEVRAENGGPLKYYEITPSAIFLDQRESYFMMVPYNWREEVRQLYGNKKSSSYTFRFLLFLRYQYELKRRSKKLQPPYQVRWSPEEMARAIKMPESVITRNPKRRARILEDAYVVAKKLGYLSDYDLLDHLHILTLNDNKYFSKNDFSITEAIGRMGTPDAPEHKAAQDLFHTFHTARQRLDSAHNEPSGVTMLQDVENLIKLLKTRKQEDIEALIAWSVQQKYWCTRLSTVRKLAKNFSEAWGEMSLRASSEPVTDANRELAQRVERKLKNNSRQVQVSALNEYIEVGQGPYSFTCIKYGEKGFKEQLESALRKWELI